MLEVDRALCSLSWVALLTARPVGILIMRPSMFSVAVELFMAEVFLAIRFSEQLHYRAMSFLKWVLYVVTLVVSRVSWLCLLAELKLRPLPRVEGNRMPLSSIRLKFTSRILLTRLLTNWMVLLEQGPS